MCIGDLIKAAMVDNNNQPVIVQPKELTIGDLIKSLHIDIDANTADEFDDSFYSQTYRSETAINKERILKNDDADYFIHHVLGLVTNDHSVLDGVEFYETCNYKGEGEGFVVKNAETEAYPIFISKHHHMM